jgi:hypothetical protein
MPWQMHMQMLPVLLLQALAGECQAFGFGHQAPDLHLLATPVAPATVLMVVMRHLAMLEALLPPRLLRWCHPGGAAAAGQTWKAVCTTSSWQGALQLGIWLW